jgi:alanine racemase
LLRDAENELARIQSLPHLLLEGIYSHLPAAEMRGEQTLAQIQRVSGFIRKLEAQNVVVRYRHIANSYAGAGLEAVSGAPFNMVRPGIDLHGVLPFGISRPYEVEPIFSLKARLVSVRSLPAGFTVGYGRTHALQRESLVGTVAIGYADGYPVKLANSASMLVNGHRCPVVGSVCMDYCQLLLDDVPDAKPGDEVTVIGKEKDEEITTGELAKLADTIEYEILCRLGRRVYKRYCYDGV